MKKPIISIILPVFNDKTNIKFAMESIIKQTIKKWELIIIDDASTDNTSDVVKDFQKSDKRIKRHKFGKNMGTAYCLNFALTISKGKFIARIDSDDYWTDDTKLQKQLKYMYSNPNFILVGTWAKAINNDNKYLFDLCYPDNDLEIRNKMLRNNCFVNSSVVFRKEILKRIGNYSEITRPSEDYDLWLRLGKEGKMHNISEFTTNYRINPHGLSQNNYNFQISQTLKIIKKYRNDYPNYYQSNLLWTMRKFYPEWFRGKTSIKIKNFLSSIHI